MVARHDRGYPVQVITTLEQLEAKVEECNAALRVSDDAMRRLFGTFQLDFSAQLPPDPLAPGYRDFQLDLYRRVTGRPYTLANERTLFDPAAYRGRPFPYYVGSTATAGQHLQAIGFLLRTLGLPPGARIVEFGPGWGNTTLALAGLGYQVTAVEIEPNFCHALRDQAAEDGVSLDVIEADFFWAETVTEPYDAAIFFECFHHCDDHLRLLRALHTALRPGAPAVFAAEPIIADYPIPWGVRVDGEALWAMRNFGWLELGFRESYFESALAHTGWTGTKHAYADPSWASIWVARAKPAEPVPPTAPAPARPGWLARWLGRG